MIVDFEKKNLIILIFMLKYSYEIPPKNSPKKFLKKFTQKISDDPWTQVGLDCKQT